MKQENRKQQQVKKKKIEGETVAEENTRGGLFTAETRKKEKRSQLLPVLSK